jgi:hypothetical protein
MKIIIYLLITMAAAHSQTAFDPKNPRADDYLPDSKEIAQRIAVSDYVVTGTLEFLNSVPTRALLARQAEFEKLSFEQQSREAGKLNIDSREWMPLAVITVDSILCRRSDFVTTASPMIAPMKMYLVNPEQRIGFHMGYRDEIFVPGTRYLFSLGVDPETEANLAKYDLDPKLAYYRVLHHSDGAIQLPTAAQRGKAGAFKPFGYQSDKDLATPVLDIATALCQAVQPANALQKADGLERLKSSPDPAMRENADIALKILRGEPLR